MRVRTKFAVGVLVLAGVSLVILTPAILLTLVPVTGTDPDTSSLAWLVIWGCVGLASLLFAIAAAIYYAAHRAD